MAGVQLILAYFTKWTDNVTHKQAVQNFSTLLRRFIPALPEEVLQDFSHFKRLR